MAVQSDFGPPFSTSRFAGSGRENGAILSPWCSDTPPAAARTAAGPGRAHRTRKPKLITEAAEIAVCLEEGSCKGTEGCRFESACWKCLQDISALTLRPWVLALQSPP